MHQFNEHHPELKGFSQFFFKEIFPFLDAREEDRQAALKKSISACVIVVVLALIMAVILVMNQEDPVLFIQLAIMAFLLCACAYSYFMRGIIAFTKAQIVGGICGYVGWAFNAEPQPPILSDWSSLMLIQSGYEGVKKIGSKRVDFEDEISGEAHGAVFNSIEVKLIRQGEKSNRTEFQGQLMSITFPRHFMGRTIVLRDKGFMQGKTKGDMKRVGLVDPMFEKIFEAYGTDQVEARYLLTPVFMQTLLDLERSVGGKNIRFGFDQNKLFIAVETPNQFEAGSMLEPLTAPARTQKILDEIGAVYDVVDIVSRAKRG